MAEVGKLNVKITADIKDLQKKLRQSQTMVNTAAKKMGKLSIKVDIADFESVVKNLGNTFADVTSTFGSLAAVVSGVIDIFEHASGSIKSVTQVMNFQQVVINANTKSMTKNAASKTVTHKLLSKDKMLFTESANALAVKSLATSQDSNANVTNAGTAGVGAVANAGLSTSFKILGMSIQTAMGVIGLVILAITAVIEVGKILAQNNESAAKSFRELKKEIKEAAEETEKDKAAMELEVATLDSLKSRLVDLSGNMEESTAARAEAKMIVDALNESNDDFNISINETTGELEGELSVIKASIDAYKARITQQSATKEYNKLIEQEIQLEKSQEELIVEINNGYKNLASIAPMAMLNSLIASKKNAEMLEENEQAQAEYIATMEKYTEAENDKQKAINESINIGELEKEMYAEKHMTVEDYYAKIEELRNSSQEDAKEQIKDYLETIADMENEHNQAIEDAQQRHIDNMGSIYDDGLSQREVTAEQILGNITKQNDQYAKWLSDMETLAASVDPTSPVLAYFEELGPEAGLYLDDFLKTIDTSLEPLEGELTEKYSLTKEAAEKEVGEMMGGVSETLTDTKDVETAAENVGTTIADEVTNGLASQQEQITTDMKTSGNWFIDGLVAGLDENAYKAFNKANGIATGIISIFSSIWDQNSPSRKAMELTGNFVKGLAIGMSKGDALIEMSGGLAKGMTDRIQSTFNSYGDTSSSVNNNTYNTTYQAATLDNDGANMADFENRIRRAYG